MRVMLFLKLFLHPFNGSLHAIWSSSPLFALQSKPACWKSRLQDCRKLQWYSPHNGGRALFFLSLIFISWAISSATCFQSYLTTEGAGNRKLSLTLQYVLGEKIKVDNPRFQPRFFFTFKWALLLKQLKAVKISCCFNIRWGVGWSFLLRMDSLSWKLFWKWEQVALFLY